jgi:hypothetical protein
VIDPELFRAYADLGFTLALEAAALGLLALYFRRRPA